MNRNRNFLAFFLLIFTLSVTSVFAQKQYTYKTYPNDPLNARIYTLDNGLTVMMTVYKDASRIQTYVAVKVGSKNDPAETTGLAHYFEHMMFKGTQNFGTVDWEKEKPFIQSIEDLFEVYRNTTDPIERKAIYAQIDSLSFEASRLAIPNEYDKLMSAIGAKGTNAGTSYDYTIYVEDIPSNELENWARIQSERFYNPVLRLFHTELETVYEEKNMYMTRDSRRIIEEILSTFFPNHPYGQHTVLGDAEHLKNPSMKLIREFYDTYYVANNMAICMSGDFDPDEAIRIIDENFSILKQGAVPEFTLIPEPPVHAPVIREFTGLDAESTSVAFRLDAGNGSREALILDMINSILYNGKCGLFDLNIDQKQRALGAWGSSMILNDYSFLMMNGRPKSGQSLEDLTALFLEQIELLKKGDFPDWIFEAALNNRKLEQMYQYENNRDRAMVLADAFMSNLTWGEALQEKEELKKLTKKDIVDFANKYFRDNYLVVYKKQGTPDTQSVEKPDITPIHINRDETSDFFQSIIEAKVKSIEPVFINYQEELKRASTKNGLEILYNKNEENGTFSLFYYFNSGSSANKKLSLAAGYLSYLGTSKKSLQEINQEFYQLACDYSVSASEDETYIGIAGLSENMERAITLLEELLSDPQPNQEALENYIDDILKSRQDNKANQNRIFSALVNYGIYGENSPSLDILSEEELRAVTAEELVGIIKGLTDYQHRILYYGPEDINEIVKVVDRLHRTSPNLLPVMPAERYVPVNVMENNMYIVDFDANQALISESFKGIPFSPALVPLVAMYNSYFGGGMNSIVFQEMREKRSLAYSAGSSYREPNYAEGFYINRAVIGTQNDKVIDALSAFDDLFKDMPLSENAFELAKESILSGISTQRITKQDIIWTYLANEKMGYTYDRRMDIYREVPGFSLKDVQEFNEKYIKYQPKNYVILGRESELNFDQLNEFGKVNKLTLEQIFGY